MLTLLTGGAFVFRFYGTLWDAGQYLGVAPKTPNVVSMQAMHQRRDIRDRTGAWAVRLRRRLADPIAAKRAVRVAGIGV